MAKRAKAGAKALTVGLVKGETTGPARPSKSRAGDTLRAFARGFCATRKGRAPDIPLRKPSFPRDEVRPSRHARDALAAGLPVANDPCWNATR
jgi:hypothetical protein